MGFILKELRAISKKLEELDKETPEMAGMDWAWDHGWISDKEHKTAEEKSIEGCLLQDEEIIKIERLRKSHPEEFEAFMNNMLEYLENSLQKLKAGNSAKYAGLKNKDRQFLIALLPDLIECLRKWYERIELKHWPAWGWRVLFSVWDDLKTIFR